MDIIDGTIEARHINAMGLTGSKWQARFLELARTVAGWSRDPSTQVGAVIVRPDRTVASLGYNGLPRGVADLPHRLADRDCRLAMTVHAEMNAILAAREPLHGAAIYVWPFHPCSACAAAIIQAGIVDVFAPPAPPELAERWASSLEATRVMFGEAGVRLHIVGAQE